MMLELTKTSGLKIFIDVESVESIEETAQHTVITTTSGNKFKVTDYCTEIYMEHKLMMEQIRNDNQPTFTLPGM